MNERFLQSMLSGAIREIGSCSHNEKSSGPPTSYVCGYGGAGEWLLDGEEVMFRPGPESDWERSRFCIGGFHRAVEEGRLVLKTDHDGPEEDTEACS
jgi:hypothetical protein